MMSSQSSEFSGSKSSICLWNDLSFFFQVSAQKELKTLSVLLS